MDARNGHFSLHEALEASAAFRAGVDEAEDMETTAQEREPILPDTTPLDVFGDSQLIGSPALPPGLLPEVIERRARDVSERLGVDPAMVALPMLATCAACLDDRIQIIPLQHDTSWKESARLWVAVIAESGQKKTPAIKTAVAPLREIERQWLQQDLERMRDYTAAMEIHASAEKMQQKIMAKALASGREVTLVDLPNAPVKPPTRRKEVKDITVEALSEVLVDNQWGLLAVHDELTGWFGSFDSYRNNAIKRDRSLYLEAYNGGPQLVDRVARGRLFVENWSLSLIGGIQPDAMRKLAGNISDDGLVQRFVPIFCHSDGLTIDRAEDEAARVLYERLIARLAYRDVGGPEARTYCRFAPEAQETRELLARRIHQVSCMPWVTKAFQTHLSKWEGLFPRFCLTWHAIMHAEKECLPETIDAETAMQVAGFMLEYLLPHAARFYTELLQTKEEEHYARWVAGHILAHDLEKITTRDIGRAFRTLRGDIRETQRTMEYLVAVAWVVPDDNGLAGGHRKWRVNPKVHERFGEQKKREKHDRAEAIRKIQEAVREFPALNERA